MYLYLIFFLFLILSFCQIIPLRIKNNPSFFHDSYWLIVLLFIFLSTFRWENGTDWESYLFYFNFLSVPTLIGYMEPGFTLLTSINAYFANYSTQLFCVAFLSIVPISIRIFKISPYPIVSLFVFFCTSLANIFPVRQSIAIAIFVFSWKYIIEQKKIKFLICIALAISFHYSAIITLPIFFLWQRRFSTKYIIISVLIMAIISFGMSNLGVSVISYLGGDFFANRIDNYLNNGDETFGSLYTKDQILIRGIINRSLLLFIFLCFLNRFRLQNNIINGLIIMYWYSFMLFLFVTPISVALGRFTNYSDTSQLLLIPFIFSVKMKRSSKIIIAFILCLYLMFRFNGVVNNYYDLYIPYNFVFFN